MNCGAPAFAQTVARPLVSPKTRATVKEDWSNRRSTPQVHNSFRASLLSRSEVEARAEQQHLDAKGEKLMVNKALEKLSNYISRRGFLGWSVKASVALASAILGVETAVAQSGSCCGLCDTSNSVCSSSCCWCWVCCQHSVGKKWKCKECFTSNPCPSGCNQTYPPCRPNVDSTFTGCPACGRGQPEFKCSQAVCLGIC